MASRIVFATVFGLVLFALVLFLVRPSHLTQDVRWKNGEVELSGTLYLPRDEGPHPAVVFVHGAGGWTRKERVFRVHAERLADMGFATLVYDKRGCGASTGDWHGASFAELADDALAAVELLRGHARIRADAVGLLATSQGGSVALLAAERSPDIAFLATLSLSTLSPEAQERDVLERGIALELEETPTSREFDPLPRLRALAIPLFAAQGAQDQLVPGPRAAEELTSLKRELDKDFTIVLVPGAGHTLRPWPGTYWSALETWLRAL